MKTKKQPFCAVIILGSFPAPGERDTECRSARRLVLLLRDRGRRILLLLVAGPALIAEGAALPGRDRGELPLDLLDGVDADVTGGDNHADEVRAGGRREAGEGGEDGEGDEGVTHRYSP